MGKVNDEQVDRGRQGTNKPWERPGQSSQDPSLEPPKKKDRERDAKDNETA